MIEVYRGRLTGCFLITSDDYDYWVAFDVKPDQLDPEVFLGYAPSGASIYRVPAGAYKYETYGVPTSRLALLVVHGVAVEGLADMEIIDEDT